jgi:hypothetical protein
MYGSDLDPAAIVVSIVAQPLEKLQRPSLINRPGTVRKFRSEFNIGRLSILESLRMTT